MTSTFFDETSEQSLVKSTIVSKYFSAWAKVIIKVQERSRRGHTKIAYVDLFAGPGQYKDGTKSTPILILETAIKEPRLRQRLVTIFNDKDAAHAQSLSKAVQEIPGITELAFPPQVRSEEVGHELVKMFEQLRMVPALFFIDPWGYRGLSLDLVNSVVKDWGCDCIFFFNYNRINMALPNQVVEDRMNILFGASRAERLRRRIDHLDSNERELEIVEQICQALKETAGRYVLPFRFKNDRGKRTSHHLIFVSKNFKGYEMMKDIMARESSSTAQGVPKFEYSPAERRQPLLFEMSRLLDELEGMLLAGFAGKTLTMRQVYELHNVDRPYIKKNYKDALRNLELAGKISARPPMDHRRGGTFADSVVVVFPEGG